MTVGYLAISLFVYLLGHILHRARMITHVLPVVKTRRYLCYVGSTFVLFAGLYVLSTDSSTEVYVTSLKKMTDLETTTVSRFIVSVPKNKTFLQMSMKERAAHVRERCAEISVWKNFTTFKKAKVTSSFLIADKYNMSLCFNRKVASTNIRRIVYSLQNEETVDDINDIKKSVARHIADFSDVPVAKIAESDNTNVIFVRDPLERLLSAYRDERGFQDFRKHMDLSFKEFLQAIAMESGNWGNEHLVSYFDNCFPCDIVYDYIGTTDTFDEDIMKVLHRVNADFVDLPQRNKTGYDTNSKNEMARFLEDVSPRLLEFIWNKYRLDYYIFGFPHPAQWLRTENKDGG